MADCIGIAFISCVNNEEEYNECQYYLNKLYVPESFHMEMIAVRGADSMAGGYNEGMRRSNAKYKVYLHQDVFIKNADFIRNILDIFSSDRGIGLLGMVGNSGEKLKSNAVITDWDVGKVEDNLYSLNCIIPSEGACEEVWAVDGLLLATQYDLPWREDLFDGWDFYDISQCMEFKKAGYKVAVPWQEEAWCYHDCSYTKLVKYCDYYEKFIEEYSHMESFPMKEKNSVLLTYKGNKEGAYAREALREEIEKIFLEGRKSELRILFQSSQLQGLIFLREYESIVHIDWLEEQNRSDQRFWQEGAAFSGLLTKLCRLKYALKRIEYGVEDQEVNWIRDNYSQYAVADVCSRYIARKDMVFNNLYSDIGKV